MFSLSYDGTEQVTSGAPGQKEQLAEQAGG
jgi:hypothetical protein